MIQKERIQIGPVEILRTDEQMPLTMDGSCCTVRQPDGSITFWTTDLGELPYYHRFRGTAENPFAEELEPFSWDYNGFPENWPCGVWVQGLYQCDDGMLIGFMHREDIDKVDPAYPNNYHIGFGVSFDDGVHWKYLGDVCSNVCNYQQKHANMGGVPFFAAKDGYFYFYFNEFRPDFSRYVSAARTKMSGAIEAIRRGILPEVKKYSGNGVWDTDPLNGIAAPMLPEVPGVYFDSHADAAYCSALDQYLLLTQTGGAGKLAMFFSDDCEHWEGPLYIDEVDPHTETQPYSTFVGLDAEASDDFSTVGHEFYIYFPRKKLGPDNYPFDTFCRRRITIR